MQKVKRLSGTFQMIQKSECPGDGGEMEMSLEALMDFLDYSTIS